LALNHNKRLLLRDTSGLVGLVLLLAVVPRPLLAQMPNPRATVHRTTGPQEPLSGNQPVTFQADRVNYDKTNGIISAVGHVEAWQNDHFLSADKITFDRNTDVAAAYGHVTIVEPDGEVFFADYAEMSQGMKNGIMKGMHALLQDNGKMAANGARRTEGLLNEMSRGLYTACDLCKLDPTRAPAWQLQASKLTQDLQNKRLEFTNAWLDLFGFPVAYSPYFSMSDPSVKRQTGFLVPGFAATDSYLGSYVVVPYFLVLDDQSDVTLTGTVATLQGPQLEADYRRAFNNGNLNVDIAGARDEDSIGTLHGDSSIGGFMFANGLFSYDDTWRYGANINLATSVDYMRDFHIPGYGSNELASTAFIEGFGVGSYERLDIGAYQGLNALVTQSLLPYVLPNFEYSYFGEPNLLGGRLSFDTQDFDVLRDVGTDDQRLAGRVTWTHPFAGLLGERYLFTAQATGAAYHAAALDEQPNFSVGNAADTAHVQPQVALQMNWPFLRDGGSLGTQVIEPIVQLIAGPNTGNSIRDRLPNEDSLDYEFTDSTLFSLNRFGGYDRFDGSARANFALHGTWTFLDGSSIDALAGGSVQEHIDQNLYPQFQPWNGFEAGKHLSDIVGRMSFSPNSWFDVTARARTDEYNRGNINFADAVASFGHPILKISPGYFYGATDPFSLYTFLPSYFAPGVLTQSNPAAESTFFTPRHEATLAVSSHFLTRYTLAADLRDNLSTGSLDSLSVQGKYEDECTIFDVMFLRRYTIINNDHGDSTLLFTITLKTVGPIGFTG
jgi:LPS-assembly protein